ncbi:MAG: hypothetical protein LBC23_02280 [Coriobacteriales bacterium]|jgi:hypothetical protein|nr:hypothetical protein [Coriobacteriales bacterium]
MSRKNLDFSEQVIDMEKRFIAEGGQEVTNELLEQWAEPWEAGEVPGVAAGFVASPGRPRLSEEKTQTVAIRLPLSIVKAIDHRAYEMDETRSQYIRDALLADLMRA